MASWCGFESGICRKLFQFITSQIMIKWEVRIMNIHVYDWGNIAGWLSGIGSFLAAVVALVLATKDNRTKIDIKIFNDKFRSFDKNGHGDNYDICVTNLRPRTIHIRSIGVYSRKKLKRKRLSKATDSENVFITSLAYGEMMTKEIGFNKKGFLKFTGTEPNDIKKLYIGIEDISGKIYYKKFTP